MKKLFTFFYLLLTINTKAQIIDTLVSKNLEEVVVAASRMPELMLRSPVSIQKLTAKQIRLSPAHSFFEALENIQGLQFITPSMGFKVLNARGFANTTNVRFAQLVDGMDVQSPHIGAAIGSSLGPEDLDIDKIEVLPGTASALYGMNTVNGLVNISTKDPFLFTGATVQQKLAVTHINDANSDIKMFTETSLRWAKLIKPVLAFKINGTVTVGSDWIANDHTDLNSSANSSTNLTGSNNPATDPVNSYGNESSNRKTITLGGKSYVVGRTGYDEKNVADYGIKNIKGDAGLYYKIFSGATLSYVYHFAGINNVYQRANRFRLQDYFLQQHGLKFKSKSIEAQLYVNNENTGKSYNLRSMAENLDRSFKPDNTWYTDYSNRFNLATANGQSIIEAHQLARNFADNGRLIPGSPEFIDRLKKLQNINNWDSGAALQVKASFIQADFQVNLTEEYLSGFKKKSGIDILVGFDSRKYIIIPDGNYFLNPISNEAYNNINYTKSGGFVALNKILFKHKIKLGAIIRADKNDYFSTKFNPRFTLVYSPVYNHNFRISFQSGYRFPSIFEAFSNVNSGGVKRVGGLSVMSHGIFENAFLQTSITNFQAAVLVDINKNGFTKNAAILKNKGLLKKNAYTYLNPEHIQSIETGYKGILLKGKLNINAEIYFNRYNNFIAQANMNVPLTQTTDSIPFSLYDKTSQKQYRMWTNSRTVIYNYGFSAGLNYLFAKNYIVDANTSFAKLKNSENEDGLEDGFNTPKWMINLSITKQNILKNLDGGITCKWQNSYYWTSFLANGNVAAYSVVNAQLTYTAKKLHSSFKIGATNLMNHYYYSYLGGPAIGGMYYATLTYGIN